MISRIQRGLRIALIGAIGLFDVLEHIENEAGFLKQLREVLKTGGRLYLTVPAFRWLWSIREKLLWELSMIRIGMKCFALCGERALLLGDAVCR